MKKVLSLFLTALMICSCVVGFDAFAYDCSVNTAQTSKTLKLDTPSTTTFKIYYSEDEGDSISMDEVYYKFTPSADGYYEFSVTGYNASSYYGKYKPEVSIYVKDKAFSDVCKATTNPDTLVTCAIGKLKKDQPCFIMVDTMLDGLNDYIQKQYAEQKLTLKVTKHSHSNSITKKTPYSNYVAVDYKCKKCGCVSKKNFYKPKTITFSTSSYTYDGKVKKPSVTVKDVNGKTISSSYYTVSYPSGRKNVGAYSVKVTFKNEYSSFKAISNSFKIKPKGTTIKSLSPSKKGFLAVVNKQTTQTTGYEIRWSTKSNMSGAKISSLTKNTQVKKSIGGLSSKKKYYVQVRTYKVVSGNSIYSSWSKAKTVITK